MLKKLGRRLDEHSDKLNVLNRLRKYKDDPKKMKKIISEMHKSIKSNKQIKWYRQMDEEAGGLSTGNQWSWTGRKEGKKMRTVLETSEMTLRKLTFSL